MTFEEFSNKIRGKNNQRPWLIRNSYTSYDIYKYMRKNKWEGLKRPLLEHEFYTIVNTLNQYYADLLAEGIEIKVPYLGSFDIRKDSTYVKMKNGKLKTNLPIDWQATLKLWYEDKEAFAKKSLIRTETKEMYFVHWHKTHLKFKNKHFFQFRPSRGLKAKLNNNVKQGKIEAYLKYDIRR